MAAWITLERVVDGRRMREQVTDMRTGKTHVRGDDRFVVEWIAASGQRKRKKIKAAGPDGKREAFDLLKKIDTGAAPQNSETSWRDAKARYLETIVPTKRAEGTQSVIKLALERFEELAAPARLQAITAETIAKFSAKLLGFEVHGGGKMRATSVNRHLRCLKGFFRVMVDWGLMVRVPKITMLDETPEERPSLSLEQFDAMYRSADKAELPTGIGTCPIGVWWRAALAIYWETGIRRCELLAIEWRNVDLSRRFFIIPAGGTKSRRPKVCTYGELTERCLRVLKEHATGEAVFVWTHDMSGLNRSLDKIKVAAGIPDRKHLSFHSARRAVGNETAERYGLDVAQAKLQHSSAAVTAKHYAASAQKARAAKAEMPIPAGLLSDTSGALPDTSRTYSN